jgi:plastocyanin
MVARMSRPGFLAVLLPPMLFVLACGGSGERYARKPVTPLDKSTTGIIRGQTILDGDPPEPTRLAVSGDPACAALHQEPVLGEDVVVHDGMLDNVFVYIKSGLGDRGFAVPTEPVQVDQRGCLYHPHVVGVQVGQPIAFVNSDPLLHNVHGTAANANGWNFGSAKGSSRTITLDRPEVMATVRCDIHPWMQAYIGAVDHPYFAVTGPKGIFVIQDVPPGQYTLAAWHERFGQREATLTLEPKGTEYVELRFTP